MRVINADTLRELCEVNAEGWFCHREITMAEAMKMLREMIDDAPTIDAVPVARCKGCRERCPNSDVSVQHCTLSGIQTEDDDYCSYGVRKGG